MSTVENLNLFAKLISCNRNLYFWTYTPELELISTTCPSEQANGIHFLLSRQANTLKTYAKELHLPLFFESDLNLIFIADFEWENDILKRIHIMGPVFSSENSYQKNKERLDKHNLSIQISLSLHKQLETICILPHSLLLEYTIMLHYCITGEKITFSDLQYPKMLERTSDSEQPEDNITNTHSGVWEAEQLLMKMFQEGNPDYRLALNRSNTLSNGMNFNPKDSLRKAKNDTLVLLTLCSRAAIEGGLSPSISYDLNDYYAQRLEDARSISETTLLSQTLTEDYILRVQRANEKTNVSPVFRNVQNYISAHITEDLSLKFLAEYTGYTEYYFSRKFKQEIGVSVSEYIKQEKIKRAKLLLRATTKRISDISAELHFSTYNYFSDMFQKMTGESPSAYRKRTQQL